MTSSTSVATFGGLASGLPVDKLIEATIAANSYRLNKYQENKDTATQQQSAYSSVKAKFSSLQTTLQTVMDSNLAYNFDLFQKKSVTVSDNSIATVSTSKGAEPGSYEIQVNSLAKAPKASVSNFAGPINSKVNLYQLGVVEGDFALAFRTTDGNEAIIEDSIDSDDTLDEFIAKLNKKITDSGKLTGNITCSVDINGVTTLDFSNVSGGTLSSADPYAHSLSNFADVFGFQISASTNTMTSVPQSSLNLDAKLSEVGIRSLGTLNLPETINIGGIEITVTADTTLRKIMNEVNETAECQVKMNFDQTSNTLNFKAKDEFYSDYIYFSGKALLSDIGLTDSNGVVKTSVQTARQNGEIVVDGRTIAIKSNKVTPADTGLTGITINLKSTTKSDEPLKIGVSNNTDALYNAVNNVLGAFNAMAKTIKDYSYVQVNASDTSAESEQGVLASDFTLSSMKMTLQSLFMSVSNDDSLDYKALAVVGFSSDESGNMTLDKTEFLNAFSDNSSDLKKLLIGNKADGTTGVFGKVYAQLKQYLDVQTGYFATKSSSLTNSITELNRSITDEQARLDQQRTSLVKQYSNLDSLISNYQSQMSSLSGISS